MLGVRGRGGEGGSYPMSYVRGASSCLLKTSFVGEGHMHISPVPQFVSGGSLALESPVILHHRDAATVSVAKRPYVGETCSHQTRID